MTPPPGAPVPTMKSLAQIEPRTPISALPYTIFAPGSYYVTTNLTGIFAQYGITIASGSVTLDLSGFTLTGVSGAFTGIYFNGAYTNVTVRNGAISGWVNGVDGLTSTKSRNTVCENLTASFNTSLGMEVDATSVVRDCLAIGNGTAWASAARAGRSWVRLPENAARPASTRPIAVSAGAKRNSTSLSESWPPTRRCTIACRKIT